jgi:hypothetical protein
MLKIKNFAKSKYRETCLRHNEDKPKLLRCYILTDFSANLRNHFK